MDVHCAWNIWAHCTLYIIYGCALCLEYLSPLYIIHHIWMYIWAWNIWAHYTLYIIYGCTYELGIFEPAVHYTSYMDVHELGIFEPAVHIIHPIWMYIWAWNIWARCTLYIIYGCALCLEYLSPLFIIHHIWMFIWAWNKTVNSAINK